RSGTASLMDSRPACRSRPVGPSVGGRVMGIRSAAAGIPRGIHPRPLAAFTGRGVHRDSGTFDADTVIPPGLDPIDEYPRCAGPWALLFSCAIRRYDVIAVTPFHFVARGAGGGP